MEERTQMASADSGTATSSSIAMSSAPTEVSSSSMVLLAVPPTTGATGQAYIQLPARQIHNVVQQVASEPAKQTSTLPTVVHLGGGQTVTGGQFVQLQGGQTLSGGQMVIQVPGQSVASIPTKYILASQDPAVTADARSSVAAQSNIPVGTRLEKLIKDNETILKESDTSALKPKIYQNYGSPVSQPPSASPSLPLPAPAVSTSPAVSTLQEENPILKQFLGSSERPATVQQFPGALPRVSVRSSPEEMEKRRVIIASQRTRVPSLVARPKSPTRRCTIRKTDLKLFTSSFVQQNVKHYSTSPLTVRTKDIICGLSGVTKVQIPGRGALSLDNPIYWCNFCPFSCEAKPEFIAHVMIHRFNCQYCSFQAYSRADVISHTVDKHQEFGSDSWHFCSFLHDNLKVSISEKNMTRKGYREHFDEGDYRFVETEVEEPVESDENLSAMLKTLTNKRPFTSPKAQTTTVPDVQEKSQKTKLENGSAAEAKDSQVLSWNCTYCDFVSQNHSLIKVHCTIMHPSMTMSAKRMKVSSEMALQIQKLDSVRQLHLDRGQKEFLQSTDTKEAPKAPVKRTPVLKTTPPPAKRPSPTKRTPPRNISAVARPAKPVKLGQGIVQSFECYNCHGQTLKCLELKGHLAEDHPGEPFIAIDLRAVRLKQARFIIYCAVPDCTFSGRVANKFVEHLATCCPDWRTTPRLEENVRDSILETLKFANKSMRTLSRCRRGKGAPAFLCRYCNFNTSFVTNAKKHVLQNHKAEKPCYLLSKVTTRGMTKVIYYFCPKCPTVENRAYSQVQQHLRQAHKNRSKREIAHTPPPAPDLSTGEDGPTVYMDVVTEDIDVKPDPAQLQAMMDDYVEKETAAKMEELGGVQRHAAVKAHVKLQSNGRLPRLFECVDCGYQGLGVNQIRSHIQTEHSKADKLVVVDLKRRSQRQSSSVHLCPKKGCSFSHHMQDMLRKHLAEEHKLETDSESESPKVTSVSPQVLKPYECLYCDVRYLTNTTAEMRDHIKVQHAGEEIIMRDVVARKLKLPSRVFLCREDNCEFTTGSHEIYSEHTESHELNADLSGTEDHDDPSSNPLTGDEATNDNAVGETNSDEIKTSAIPVRIEPESMETESIINNLLEN